VKKYLMGRMGTMTMITKTTRKMNSRRD